MGEKILITGGSGFIGSEVVAIALARGDEVLNLDINPPRDAAQAPFWRQIDVRDRDAVMGAITAFAPDRLLHLASDIDITIQNLAEFRTTIGGTANVLAAAAQLPQLKRFVHVSTQFVVKPGVEPRDERFLDPYTVYGEAKAETEKLVWNANLSMPWFILRPVIIWGPHHPTFAREIFRHMRSGRYLHPVDRTPISRAFGYVTNVADQMMAFATMDAAQAKRHVYYVGDESIDYDMWADAFSVGLTGKRARRIPVWLLKLLGKAGDLAKAAGVRSPIDSGRAFRMSTSSRVDLAPTIALTGTPPVAFDEGVKRTLAWLRTAS
ncbi:MAG: NAD(P)-dependent oxidoreductase [Rhizobiales bacterium]|nr:NAD(P)-dependent oxidoreductase [Hyphomicrobiales bacterium]